MAELNDALTHLGPVDWNDVPQDNLEQYLTDTFAAGELICNSVPQVPEGTPFHDSKPHHHEPNTAKSHKEMHSSHARGHPPHEEHAKLAKQWGKPMKFKKETNPLDVSLYKMAGHDRHGAWFARRSVHEGLGFDKFKRAMLREFPQSLSVEGGPGAGAIRGLAADRRLERIDVKGVGKLEVYQLSSVFPGPVTPRDFVTLLLSSDGVLTDKSAAELEGGKRHVPRHFMLISKPVQHPDAPARSGLVRGQYESVELIREVPLAPSKSKSTPNLLSSNGTSEQHTRERGHTVGTANVKGASASDQHLDVPGSSGEGDPELNPVEWIMITRSDPGGGLPRFLVERGTPEPMIQDVHKFFDWACSLDHRPHPDEGFEEQEKESISNAHTTDQVSTQTTSYTPNGDNQEESKLAPPIRSATGPVPRPNSQGGIFNNITRAIGTGIDTYAPAAVAVADRVSPYLNSGEVDSSDDSSDTSSVDSFMSAEEMRRISTAPEEPKRPTDSTDVLSIASADLSDLPKDTKDMSHHEKEVYKITQKRERLEQQLARKRMEQEQKLKQTQEKGESESSKQKEEMEKKLKKTEEKHKRELEKLEQKKAKELRKVEDKRKKKDEQHKLSLVTRERDEFRSQVDLYRRENSLLQEQVADLQKQNTLMAQKLQPEALQSVKEEFGRNRKGSMRSTNSAASSRSNERKIDAVS
ncbi:hypothetical protein CLAFUW4_00256 [Fulvia fulva]|uniref:DUF3074 domain-containing protein n=1 Tax=Passalora fulva TaxID=5499 RepID=A0A9Q8P2N2_PASFU|nr:uncharacterized protein CLAFUR5_00256 [Fulvia fulva]KAK4635375.1 hypothetical protein CLAFUR4_00256 [Fulvia fulva]KAK4638342.1 hypothetical protein CLAFUR0_00257 [Fulvia fulva]UJO10847.1 hypothetical protein CLAFUR5_00256 [Fulvia fulva]WPV08686.1 hypothetical protein CLAFUW4_00256 [Fulvia fulva]WPV25072.1 hypothetical protein CLAFUW7_00260 [Fulvia fulva]